MAVVRLCLAGLVPVSRCGTETRETVRPARLAPREALRRLFLTYVSQVDEAVLADVGAGAGLRRDDGAGAALLIADDAELRRLDTGRQVHVEHRAQLLQ